MGEDFSKRPLGVIPSPPDFRDYRLYEFTDIETELPDNYLVPPYEKESDIPVYDQGYTSNPYKVTLAVTLAYKY